MYADDFSLFSSTQQRYQFRNSKYQQVYGLQPPMCYREKISFLEIIAWTRLDSIDPIENDKKARLETIKLISKRDVRVYDIFLRFAKVNHHIRLSASANSPKMQASKMYTNILSLDH